MKIFLTLIFILSLSHCFSQRVSSTHYYYFKSSSEKLSREENKKLKLLCDTLFRRQVVSVMVIAHTDDSGEEDDNMILSEKRAENIKKSMISFGVPSEKISIVAMGENNPIAPNTTEKGKATNRRAEVNVIWEE